MLVNEGGTGEVGQPSFWLRPCLLSRPGGTSWGRVPQSDAPAWTDGPSREAQCLAGPVEGHQPLKVEKGHVEVWGWEEEIPPTVAKQTPSPWKAPPWDGRPAKAGRLCLFLQWRPG